jgi:hypothetical protein
MANLNFENIQINPVALTWENQAIDKVTVATVAGLAGDYFLISAPEGDFYGWFDDGVVADPALAGKTGVAITYTGTESKSALATAIASAFDTETEFHAKAYGEYCLLQRKTSGVCAASTAGTALTALTHAVVREGFLLDVGLTEDLEIAFGSSIVDVTASQLGATVVERLRNGMNIEAISINMKEVVASKIKSIMEPHFPAYTPVGVGSTEVQGIGNSKDFSNVSADSGKLVFHPIKLADSNLAEDFAMFRACPLLTNINFSGESEQMMSVEFSILPDALLKKEVAHGVYGDHTQNFLK